MSSISLLGSPVECYTYGFVYMAIVLGDQLAIPPIAIWFAPYYNRLRIISAYEVQYAPDISRSLFTK